MLSASACAIAWQVRALRLGMADDTKRRLYERAYARAKSEHDARMHALRADLKLTQAFRVPPPEPPPLG